MATTEEAGGRGTLASEFLRAMLRSRDSAEVLATAARFAAAASGVSPDDVVVTHGYDGALPDGHPAMAEAIRTGERLVLGDADAYRRRYPDAPAAGECRGGTVMVFPVERSYDAPDAAIAAAWDRPVSLSLTAIDEASLLAGLVARIFDRRRSIEMIRADAHRSAAVASVAEQLADVVTVAELVRVAVEEVPGSMGAKVSVIGIVDHDNGVLRRHFGEDLSGQLAADYAEDPLDRSTPMVRSALNGEVLLYPSREVVAAKHEDLLEVFDAVGCGAFASVPLRDRHGVLCGALGVGWADPVEFSGSLLAQLQTIGQLVSQTLQRTQLADVLLEETQRAQNLAAFSRLLALAETPDDVHRAVTEGLPAFRRVKEASLEWLDPTGLAPTHASRAPLSLQDALADADLSGHIRLPLRSGAGTLLGNVEFSWEPEAQVAEAAGSSLVTAVELLVATMQRISASQAERHLISDLQQRVLTPVPPVPGLEVACRYQPAQTMVAMGGDWYQAIELADGRMGVVVGDVVGHGASAAADMTHLSGMLATLLRLGTPLEVLFARVEEALGPVEILATVAVCEVDPDRELLRYVSAGHPPLLLADPDGSVEVLAGGRTSMVGVAAPATEVGEARFVPGATLLAYTDGLVERRGEGLDVGTARLADALASVADLAIEAQLDEILRRCRLGVEIQDDIALMAVRSVSAGRGGPGRQPGPARS